MTKTFKRNSDRKKWHFKTSLFAKYFILFAVILSVVVIILGTALIIILNRYYIVNERTQLKSNISAVVDVVEGTLDAGNINYGYSADKKMICKTLDVIYQSTGTDIFICNMNGKSVLCKELNSAAENKGKFETCSVHEAIALDDEIVANIQENGEAAQQLEISGRRFFTMGKAIYLDNETAGFVFALANTGVLPSSLLILRMFLLSALFCLILGYICIYYITKKMVAPLEQMSKAAQHFASGDFSYRIDEHGYDEMANLSKAFNDMATSLDKLESSRSGFISNVSHELKTPMTSISGFINGILDGTIPPEKQNYYLKIVSSEIDRLSRLVVSMLNMSKIESGEIELNPGDFDISEKIINILLTFEQRIEEKNIDIRGLDTLPECHITADPDLIYQAIYNLFDNAVKFTNNGGYIEVRITEDGIGVKIEITNSGDGIKERELSRIFERFYKVDKSRSLDLNGAGLGLYIVKLTIELHKGSITADSDGTSYTKFTVYLPKKIK